MYGNSAIYNLLFFTTMTIRELIFNETGYECKTTFCEDFGIAEKFGISAVEDTYKRAFAEWKDNVIYLTELVLVLNWKIWQWYEKDERYARVYNELWLKADRYAYENLKGEDAGYYFSTLD